MNGCADSFANFKEFASRHGGNPLKVQRNFITIFSVKMNHPMKAMTDVDVTCGFSTLHAVQIRVP